MSYMDFLLWVRGPAFEFSVAVFVFGVTARLLEILLLPNPRDYSEARASGVEAGFASIWRRFLPAPGVMQRGAMTVVGGYVFHIGLFISLLLFVPHIELLHALTGIRWPGLPNAIVDFAAVLAMVALVALLIHRFTHPVLRQLTTLHDILVWKLTFMPLLTGYLAYHHLLLPYPLMLALHILSVEFLLIFFPFTKLMHTFTLFIARFYNGALAGRKGVQQ